MAKLRILEVVSYTEWQSAVYRSGKEEYEILYSKDFNSKRGGETVTLIGVNYAGEPISSNNAIYREIEDYLAAEARRRAA